MLAVIFPTDNSERLLAHSLATLVPAVVDGLVRRVAVIDSGSTDDTALVAEGAGCSFHPAAEIECAVTGLNAPWLLILQPGALLPDGWVDRVRMHVEKHKGPAQFMTSHDGRLGGLLQLFGTKRKLDAGLLIERQQFVSLLRDGVKLEDMPQRLKPIRLKQVVLAVP
ncbi:glycosyl transferase [Daeguia caeni]|uniref:Glycosyl transferase n=1 Tax=Daeguia caeni TaxID=439612 RepID=A0ABV9H705_9HYPH